MTSFKRQFKDLLDTCRTLEDFDYVQEKLEMTNKINRRTIEGRELTQELQWLLLEKKNEAINKYNLQPF